MARCTKYVKPEERQILTAEVVASKRISPNFVRVTLGGTGLACFTPMGFDQWFRLFLPGRHGLRLPSSAVGDLWWAQCRMMSEEQRPVVRNYTVREHRPAGAGQFGETAEIDIDFAMHGEHTPACGWASGATPGAPVGLLDEGIMYQVPQHCSWSLLAGDESALAAIAGALRSAPRDQHGAAYIEIAHPDDSQDLGEPEGVQVNWLVRDDPHAPVGSMALDVVRAADLPSQGVYGFVAGEQKLAGGVRRHLVADRGIPKADVTFTGYWRFGRSVD
ncbi:siderophore-interacting protein [Nocardia arthritidis]|uniref:Siderophore-interacting protein n=1 Tax=Nocardia arthritidis TaxID=228602 RepID=A0A6G9YLK4_9NOCA|nr:siderophore-interacting protein [Nocardia arthritidis]QIS14082.1 siderophore-interacting protein [Nocardia arthritidis]